MKAVSFVAVSLAACFFDCREYEAEKKTLAREEIVANSKDPTPVPKATALVEEEKGQFPDNEKKTGGDKPPRGQGVYARLAAFSPDNKFVLVGFGGDGGRYKGQVRTALADSLVLYDVASGKEIRRLKGHPPDSGFPGGVGFVSFLPDGNRAISGFGGGAMRVWDVRSGKELGRILTPDGFGGAALMPDGKHLVTYTGDTIELWDIKAGNRLKTETFPKVKSGSLIIHANISSVIPSPNGEMAFISSYTSYLWDVRNWRLITKFRPAVGRPPEFSAIGRPGTFSPDSKYLVAGKDEKGKRCLALWDIAKEEEIREIGEKDLKPINVTFSSDGKIIARNDAGRLVCWSAEGKLVWETKSKDLEHLSLFVFSTDRKLAVSNYAGLFVAGEMRPAFIDEFESRLSLRIWNLEKGTSPRSLSWPTLPEGDAKKGETK